VIFELIARRPARPRLRNLSSDSHHNEGVPRSERLEAPPEPATPDRVPSHARPLVLLLVLAMLASAVFVWEPWPLTSFRLFSHVRHDEQTAWVATIADARGEEIAYPIDTLDEGFRNFGFRMAEFSTAVEGRRDELCRTWVDAATQVAGPGAREVRLYRRTWRVTEREGDRALPGTRELVFVCTGAGVRVVG
jgi:hypothetical protein